MCSLRKKSYFLCPTPGSTPEAVQLGSIIVHPRRVAEPLNRYVASPESSGEKVFVHDERDSSVKVHRSSTGSLSFLAHSSDAPELGHIGTRADGGSESCERWAIPHLQTAWFSPSAEYVRASFQDPDVASFLSENPAWLRPARRLYMVTGVKIAHGATCARDSLSRRGLRLHHTVDPSPSPLADAPFSSGPSHAVRLRVGQTGTFHEPFVFAFRLRRISVSASGKVKHRDYTRGAVL
ncbi:hypothetical protein VTK73DRAFT_793 [Phialemonium thermophilum]|uniref:Uncharacterized protein n=1 Tax=Phialemonium thermophilum TaxID=223376 RepID=A0ABR3VU96_9PEZI